MWPPGAIIQLLQSHWKLVSDFLMGKKHTKRPKKCVFCPKQVRTRSRLDFFPKKIILVDPPWGTVSKFWESLYLIHIHPFMHHFCIAIIISLLCRPECLQEVHEHFCSIYRANIDQHFEKYVVIIDQNYKVSEKYEHGWNLAKIKQENDLQAGKMSGFYAWF